MLYRKVRIHRDAMTVITKFVPSHEIIVMQVIFSPECVEVQKGYKLNAVPYLPEPLERERLDRVYGIEAVHEAYGSAFDVGRIDKLIPAWARYASKVLNAVTRKPVRGIAELAVQPSLPERRQKGAVDLAALAAVNAALAGEDGE